jgi:4a-hydroxytetrahydrobiopterin dehydratase
MALLNSSQIARAMLKLPQWKKAGKSISRTYVFRDFPAAIRLVSKIAELAEKVNHHPDIDIRWNKVTLSLTTHDTGGLTARDFKLARKFDLA